MCPPGVFIFALLSTATNDGGFFRSSNRLFLSSVSGTTNRSRALKFSKSNVRCHSEKRFCIISYVAQWAVMIDDI